MAKIRIKLKPNSSSPASDNTRVKRGVMPLSSDQFPKYTYKKGKFTATDSLDYKKGFNNALKNEESQKENELNPYRKRKGTLVIVGLNDRFNEGYSEGRDVVLNKKNKK